MRIYNIMLGLLACGAFCMTSCSDDEFTEVNSVLSVTSAETSMAAAGETKEINVAGPLTSAYSPASWLAVSQEGQVVSVTADPNGDKQSRNAIVILKASATDSIVVNISQFGARLDFTVPEKMTVLSHAGSVTKLYFLHDVPVEAVSSEEWIQAEVMDDSLKLTFDANPAGTERSGYVDVSIVNGESWRIPVTQVDIRGNYELTGTDMRSGAAVTLHGALTGGETGNDLVFSPVEYPDLAMPLCIFPETSSLAAKAGGYCGVSGRYYVYTTIVDAASKLQVFNGANSMSGELTVVNGLYCADLSDNGSCWPGTDSKAEILRMMTFSRQNPAATSMAGTGIVGVRNPSFKQVAASSAKPF